MVKRIFRFSLPFRFLLPFPLFPVYPFNLSSRLDITARFLRLILRATPVPLFAQTVAARDALVYPFEFFVNQTAHAAQEVLLEFSETVRDVLRQNGIRRIAQITQPIFDSINRTVRLFIRLRHKTQPPLDKILVANHRTIVARLILTQ